MKPLYLAFMAAVLFFLNVFSLIFVRTIDPALAIIMVRMTFLLCAVQSLCWFITHLLDHAQRKAEAEAEASWAKASLTIREMMDRLDRLNREKESRRSTSDDQRPAAPGDRP